MAHFPRKSLDADFQIVENVRKRLGLRGEALEELHWDPAEKVLVLVVKV